MSPPLCPDPCGRADAALGFFDEVSRIDGLNYIPTQTDVLRARAKSTGITGPTIVRVLLPWHPGS